MVCLPVVLVVHLPVVLAFLEVVTLAPLLSQFSSVFALVFFAVSARTLAVPAHSVLQCRLLLCAEKNPLSRVSFLSLAWPFLRVFRVWLLPLLAHHHYCSLLVAALSPHHQN